VSVARSILLFAVAALFEIGGAWPVWQGIREHRGWVWAGLGVVALGAYGFVATFKTILNSAASWPLTEVWDIIGAAVCLAGVGVIMYAPRGR
jgi:small multidrug resistance family-3 protein